MLRARRHALALAFSLCVARAAAAQTSPTEAEHQRGMQLRAQGHDAEAAAVFRAIFERTGEPRALARLGLAEGALLRWAEAEEHLQGALDRTSDPWVTANRANLEGVLRAVREHLGFVNVTCATPGATVQWSGQPPVPLPLPRPLRVPTGFLDLVVYAPGHRPATRHVAIPAGADPVVVDVALVPDPAATPPAPVVTPPAVTPPAVTPPVVTPPATSDEPARPWQRPLGIGLLIGGGASLALGVTGFVLRNGAASRFNNAGCRLYPDHDALSIGGATCADDLSSTQTGQTLAVAGLVGAGVLTAAGLTAFLLAPRVSSHVRVSLGPAALGVSVTF